MTTLPTEKEAALAAYNSVVADAELRDITLIFTTFVIKPDYYKLALEDEDTASKVKRELDSNFSAFTYDAERRLLGGQFDWSVEATFGRRKLLNARASFIVSYENVPDVDGVHMEAFIKRVGRFATYPYFRSLVSQFSWESKAELPPLPVLK